VKPIEVTRVIERPLEEVFRFAGDSENNPKWLGVFEKVQKTSEGPLGVGTTFKDVARMMGRRFETQSELTDYVPNRLYARRVTTGPFSRGRSNRLRARGQRDPGEAHLHGGASRVSQAR
jgi:uncharacterized membrane protein